MKPEHTKYILENADKKSAKQISRELNIPERKIKRFLQQTERVDNKTNSANPPKPNQNKKILFFAFISIIALGFIVYANSLNGQFIWDDIHLIKNNALIKSLSGIAGCFTKDIGAGAGKVFNFYRPLQIVTYAIDYSVWKFNVIGYHFTNILLHILAALAVYWLINTLYNNRAVSLLTSVLFVIHPIHTEAVSYISGRADSLAALFMLLCCTIYIKRLNQNRPDIRSYILMVLTYILALLSRENSLILPVLLLFYHFVFKKKIKPIEFLSLLCIAAIYITIRFTYLKSILPAPSPDTALQRLPGLFAAILNYIKLLFLPFGLHMEYGLKLFRFADPRVIAGIILTFAILVFAYLKRNNKIILFSIGWFFLALLPMSNLYKINAYMAEHFLYLPSIGFFLVFAYLLNVIYNNKKYKAISLTLITCCIPFYSILTIIQNNYWKDPFVFYERTLKFAPDSAKVYYNRGTIYSQQGNYGQAILDFTRALELRPDDPEIYNNRGNAYGKKGDNDRAISDYTKAIELNPDDAEIYSNRGVAYGEKNNYNKAIIDLTRAIELNPDCAETYINRGNAYGIKGSYDQAISDFTRAIELRPDYAGVYSSRGNAYIGKGDYDHAISDFSKAIELEPYSAQAYGNLGVAYANKGMTGEAKKAIIKSLEIDPANEIMKQNLEKLKTQ